MRKYSINYNVLIFVTTIFYFFSLLYSPSPLYKILLISSVAIFFPLVMRINEKEFVIGTLFLLLGTFRIFCLIAHGTSLSIAPILNIVLTFVLLLILIRGKKGYYLYLLLLVMLVLIEIYWILNGYSLNNFFPETSRNTFSTFGIFIASVCYVSIMKYKSNANPPIMPALLALVISLLAAGRSGIGASIFMLLGILLFQTGKRKIVSFIFVIFCFAILMVTLIESGSLNHWISSLSIEKYSIDRITTDPRFEMISNYVQDFSAKELLFGQDLKKAFFLSNWKGNPHNSYIKLQSNYGISSFVIFMAALMSLISMIKNKSPLAVVFIAISLRIFTDSTLFDGFFDFVIYYLIFSPFIQKFQFVSIFRNSDYQRTSKLSHRDIDPLKSQHV